MADDRWRQSNLGRLLVRAFRVFERDMLTGVQKRSAGVGVRMPHLAVMRNIDRTGTRISEIARRAGLSKQHIGSLVRELESLDLVHVELDAEDNRARIVHYTDKGLDGLRIGRRVYGSLLARYKRELGSGEIEELQRLLGEFVRRFEKDSSDGF